MPKFLPSPLARYALFFLFALAAAVAAYQLPYSYQSDVGKAIGLGYLGNFYGLEDQAPAQFFWTRATSQLHFPGVAQNIPYLLTLRLSPGPRPDDLQPATVRLSVNGQPFRTFEVQGPAGPYRAVLDPARIARGDDLTVQLQSETFVPAKTFPGSGDRRELGVVFERVRLEPTAGGPVLPPLGLLLYFAGSLVTLLALFERLAPGVPAFRRAAAMGTLTLAGVWYLAIMRDPLLLAPYLPGLLLASAILLLALVLGRRVISILLLTWGLGNKAASTPPGRRVTKWLYEAGPICLLFVQNLVIFSGHYFHDEGFPWDFEQGYYGYVAFWTSALQKGVFPQWMPFQQMGYPFALLLQSYMNYPPLWLFPLLHIPYTLNAAVILQALHVAFGAVGMYLLSRQTFHSNRLALIGAFVFQFFGGFYGQAEHPDIVRGFTFAPWLMWLLTLDREQDLRLSARALFIPLGFYFLFTGAYAGQTFAMTFVMAAYVLFQLVDLWMRGHSALSILKVGAAILGLVLLGVALSAVQLGPPFIFREELARYHFYDFRQLRANFTLDQLTELFLGNKSLDLLVTMSSFVSLPALVLASFAPLDSFRRNWPYVGVGLVALLMAGGEKSFFYSAVTTLIPPLEFSRFPTSDYRIFFIIPVLLFALAGLQGLLKRELSWKSIGVRSLFVLSWFAQGVYAAYGAQLDSEVLAAGIMAGLSLVAALTLARWVRRLSIPVLICILALISLDALRVLPEMPTWHEPNISSFQPEPGSTYLQDGQLAAFAIFDRPVAARPARSRPPASGYWWEGYIDGKFLMWDVSVNIFAPAPMERAGIIASNQTYEQYMLLPWQPIFLSPDFAGTGTDILMPDLNPMVLLNGEAGEASPVQQTKYGINGITYQVSLEEPKLMVENEMYYPGWDARLVSGNSESKIEARSVNGEFRAWLLPAGQYQMVANYALPGLYVYYAISLAAMFFWLGILFVAYKRRQPRHAWQLTRPRVSGGGTLERRPDSSVSV